MKHGNNSTFLGTCQNTRFFDFDLLPLVHHVVGTCPPPSLIANAWCHVGIHTKESTNLVRHEIQHHLMNELANSPRGQWYSS